MASTTTTALSTTMPTASISPSIDNRFSESPRKYITVSVNNREAGMVAAMSAVMRHSRRKSTSTSTARNPPSSALWVSAFMLFSISVPWSKKLWNL